MALAVNSTSRLQIQFVNSKPTRTELPSPRLPNYRLSRSRLSAHRSDRLLRKSDSAWRSAAEPVTGGSGCLLPAVLAAGHTFPARGPTRGQQRTTLPGRTRRAHAHGGPPPWRQCCPERSSSRVRSLQPGDHAGEAWPGERGGRGSAGPGC